MKGEILYLHEQGNTYANIASKVKRSISWVRTIIGALSTCKFAKELITIYLQKVENDKDERTSAKKIDVYIHDTPNRNPNKTNDIKRVSRRGRRIQKTKTGRHKVRNRSDIRSGDGQNNRGNTSFVDSLRKHNDYQGE